MSGSAEPVQLRIVSSVIADDTAEFPAKLDSLSVAPASDVTADDVSELVSLGRSFVTLAVVFISSVALQPQPHSFQLRAAAVQRPI